MGQPKIPGGQFDPPPRITKQRPGRKPAIDVMLHLLSYSPLSTLHSYDPRAVRSAAIAQGIVDFSLAEPPHKTEEAFDCPSHGHRQMFDEVIRQEVAKVISVGEIEHLTPALLAGVRGGRGPEREAGRQGGRSATNEESGIGGRLTDGLENPDSNQPQVCARGVGRRGQRCIRMKGTSQAAPEAVRQAVGGGCESGWGRLLSVTIALEPGSYRQGDSGSA